MSASMLSRSRIRKAIPKTTAQKSQRAAKVAAQIVLGEHRGGSFAISAAAHVNLQAAVQQAVEGAAERYPECF